MRTYEAPSLQIIGTVHDVTQQSNKCGLTPDFITNITGIVGEVIVIQPGNPCPPPP